MKETPESSLASLEGNPGEGPHQDPTMNVDFQPPELGDINVCV